MKPFVLHVAFLEHELLVVLDQINKRLVPVFPLHEKVAAVFGRALLEPHVVVDGGGNQIAPPMVPKLVRKQVAVGEVALFDHETGVGDVGRDLQRTVGGQHVTDTFPRVRTPPVFQSVDGVPEVGKFGLHRVAVGRLACEPDRDVPVRPAVHVIVVDVRPHRDGTEVGRDRMVQFPRAEQGVSAKGHFFDEVALVVGAAPTRAENAVRVGGPFHEIVEARVPDPTKVGRDRGQPDAEVVNQVAGVVHPAPVGVGVGVSSVPNVERDGFAFHQGGRRVHVKFLPPLGEGDFRAVPFHAVHDEPLQVPPHRRAASQQHGKGDGGMGVEGLGVVPRHVEKEVVMRHVEAVASRDAWPHVVVVDRQKPSGRRLVVGATDGVASLGEKRDSRAAIEVVKAGERGLGCHRRGANQRQDSPHGKAKILRSASEEHATKLGVLSPHETRRSGRPR